MDIFNMARLVAQNNSVGRRAPWPPFSAVKSELNLEMTIQPYRFQRLETS